MKKFLVCIRPKNMYSQNFEYYLEIDTASEFHAGLKGFEMFQVAVAYQPKLRAKLADSGNLMSMMFADVVEV